ncbi:MAG: hypothetical protein V4793_32185, partial [Paraburkholderia tropica]
IGAAQCRFRCVLGHRIRVLRVLRVLFNGAGQLLHACRRFLQRGSLLFRTRRQIEITRRNFAGRLHDGRASAPHGTDGFGQRGFHRRKAVEQLAHFVA